MLENSEKRILFVCDYYYPAPTSIGLCVHKIAKEFLKRGYHVSVLCYGDRSDWNYNSFDGIKIYHVRRKLGEQLVYLSKQGKTTLPKKLYGKAGLAILRIQQLLFFPWFRLSSLRCPYRYYKKIEEIYTENPFKILCSSHAPFDGTLGAYWFKKRHPEVIHEMYILDSLSNKGNTKWVSSDLNDKKGWQWEQRFYKTADLIVDLKCDELHNQKARYNIFRQKMHTSDIPLFDSELFAGRTDACNIPVSTRYVMVYAGRLLSHLSSPAYLCRLLEQVSNETNIQMHFYSSGDCENMINSLDSDVFIYEGLVRHEELMKVYINSDMLVSIGSEKNTDAMPSKIFEYMSTGKKILHIAKQYDDICINYYANYPQALVLYENDDIDTNADRLSDFIATPPIPIDAQKLKALFKENTPEYTVDIMESICVTETEA